MQPNEVSMCSLLQPLYFIIIIIIVDFITHSIARQLNYNVFTRIKIIYKLPLHALKLFTSINLNVFKPMYKRLYKNI